MKRIEGDFGKILLILVGRLGDYIVSTAFHKAIRNRFPGAEIHFITGKKAEYLAKRNENFTRVMVLENWLNPTNISFLRLKKANYDLAIDLNPAYSRTSIALMKLSGAGIRVSFEKKCPPGTYTHLLAHDPDREHFLDKYANLAKFIGAEYEPKLEVKTGKKAEMEADSILSKLGIKHGELFILVHPGNFKKFHQRWPEEKFARFTKKILERHEIRIFYLAGPGEEKTIRERILTGISDVKLIPPQKIDITGALLKKSRLLICNNSSTLHLADAVGIPFTLSFNTKYNALCWKPRGKNHFSVETENWRSCRDISVDDALEKFETILPRVLRNHL